MLSHPPIFSFRASEFCVFYFSFYQFNTFFFFYSLNPSLLKIEKSFSCFYSGFLNEK